MRRLYLLLCALVSFGVFLFLTVRLGFEGDTQTLVDHVFNSVACVSRGQFTHCPDTGSFPIFQYLPSALIVILGGGRSAILHVLCYASLIAFILSFVEMWRGLKPRSETVAWVGILVLVSGFWLRYANLSFGEMVASYFTLCFVASFIGGRSLLRAGLFAFATTLTKETAFLFLALLIVCTVYFVPEAKRTARDGLKVGGAILLGVCVNSLFNIFRWGTPINMGYLGTGDIITDPWLQANYFLATWFSPAGGIVLYWTSFALLALILLVIGLRDYQRKEGIPAITVLVVLLGLTLGFSKWFTPLGGYAWGDRLMLPWIPALAFFSFWVYAREFSKMLSKWSQSPGRFWSASVALALVAFPQYAILLRHSLIGKALDHGFWPSWPWGVLEFYLPVPRPDLFLLAAFMSTWVFAICVRIRTTLKK